MALNATTLKGLIYASLQAKCATEFPQSVDALADYHMMMADAISSAIVPHITAAAVVAVSSLTVVTACPAGAGTGTGTGTGSIT